MTVEAVESGSHIQFRAATWCCDEMSAAWMRGIVVFGDTSFKTINQNPQVCFVPEGVGRRGFPIEHCPFCNGKISVNITKSGE